MTPAHCRIKHDPENGAYGDCVRACVATILDMDTEEVPHFFHDDCDGETGAERIREFLGPLGYAPFFMNFNNDVSRDDILKSMHVMNPGVPLMFYGGTSEGDHVVVAQDGEIVHDPAWFRTPIVKPASHGYWTVCVIAVK